MSLSSWNKNNIFKFSIDNEHVDETLTDFPVLLNLGSTSGKNNFDCSDVFNHLTTGSGNDIYTKLLIHSNTADGSVVFTDSSSSEHFITGVDTVHHEADQIKFGTSSIYFDGVSDYLSIPDSDDFHFGSGDFTIDFWASRSRTGFTDRLFGQSTSGATEQTCRALLSTDGFFSVAFYGTTTQTALSTTAITNTNWHHYAIVRNGSIFSIYIDGVLEDTLDVGTESLTNSSTIFAIGALGLYTANRFKGYIDEFRISKGLARWSSSFTVPTTPYTDVILNNKKIAIVYPSVQEHWVQEYTDNYTVLLIHSDDNDSSTTFIDSSDSNHTITENGHTHHETDQSVFGSTAIYFDGAGDYLSIPNSTDFVLGTEDFTIDFRIQFKTFNTASDFIFFCRYNSTSNQGWQVYRSATSGFGFLADTGSTYTVSDDTPGNMVVDTWYHLAITRSDGVLRLFIDGIIVKEELSFTYNIPLSNDDLVIGVHPATGVYDLDGYLDEIRISKGTARWTENFTSPTAPYSKENVLKQYIHGEQEQLFCEIERWDQTNEDAQLWVKVPRILSDQPTDLLLYYDNTQEDNDYYVGDTTSWPAQQVWDENFVFVSHQAQDPSGTAPQILDSTSYAKHGTSYGTMLSEDLVASPTGKALDYDGIDDKIIIPTFDESTLTLEIYCKYSALPSSNGYRFVHKYNGAGTDSGMILFDITTTYLVRGLVSNGTASGPSYTTTPVVDTWYNMAFAADSSAFTLFEDGIQKGTSGGFSIPTSSVDFSIGEDASEGSQGEYFKGLIKEVRISNIVRSTAWLSSTHYVNKDTLINVSQADIFQFTGYIKEFGEPVERTVYLYDRASGELIDKNISNSLGYYTLNTTTSGTHNIVCLDASSAPDFDDLIISKVTPTENI